MDNLHVVEYSPSQGVFHRQPLTESLKENLKTLHGDPKKTDYHIIFVGSEEESVVVAHKMFVQKYGSDCGDCSICQL